MHAFCGQRRFDFAGPFVTVHVKMCSMLVVGVVFIANKVILLYYKSYFWEGKQARAHDDVAGPESHECTL
jgi:hypothetical protein